MEGPFRLLQVVRRDRRPESQFRLLLEALQDLNIVLDPRLRGLHAARVAQAVPLQGEVDLLDPEGQEWVVRWGDQVVGPGLPQVALPEVKCCAPARFLVLADVRAVLGEAPPERLVGARAEVAGGATARSCSHRACLFTLPRMLQSPKER